MTCSLKLIYSVQLMTGLVWQAFIQSSPVQQRQASQQVTSLLNRHRLIPACPRSHTETWIWRAFACCCSSEGKCRPAKNALLAEQFMTGLVGRSRLSVNLMAGQLVKCKCFTVQPCCIVLLLSPTDEAGADGFSHNDDCKPGCSARWPAHVHVMHHGAYIMYCIGHETNNWPLSSPLGEW